ncbi:MAG: VanZ family protein [Oscillospiraceae bacterium]
MYRFFDMGLEAGVAAVILVPLFLVVNRIYFHDLGRTVGYLIFAIYLAGVDAVVGLPCITYIRLGFNYNFVPFLYMFSDCKNSLLNVLLFVPLGFFLPLFWKKFSAFGYTLLFGFCTSLLIELLQIFTFRATDVNDLITNTVGTVLGYLLARVVLKLFPGRNRRHGRRMCFSSAA